MKGKSELEKTVEYALGGAPKIKPDEKRKWLGEFRERVILGLTIEQVYEKNATAYVEKAIKEKEAEIIIVNQKIPMEVVSQYMKLAKDTGKEFKTVLPNHEGAMGIVVASSKAVERENVELETLEMPEIIEESSPKRPTGLWEKISSIFKK